MGAFPPSGRVARHWHGFRSVRLCTKWQPRNLNLRIRAALINSYNMKCLKCGAVIAEGQNYCGGCGHQLKNVCSGCGTTNPPFFKFCGQCGRNLADVGTLLLDRAGLILEADAAALDLLALQSGTAIGKPFSLFVNVDDLVLFYSHWNELIRSSRRQNLEIELNPTRDIVIHAQLVLRRLSDPAGEAVRIRMEIGDVTDRRQILQALQEKQDLIELIASLTDIFHPPNSGVRGKTIGGVLEKMGLISEGQYGFIARIDAERKRLVTEFQWHASAAPKADPGQLSMAFKRLRPVLETLLKGEPYAVDDINALAPTERNIWRTWHHQDSGAILCHLIYRRRKPFGVIGLAKDRPGHWPRPTIFLVKLAGRLMADTLSQARPGRAVIKPVPALAKSTAVEHKHRQATGIIDVEEVEIIIDDGEGSKNAGATPSRMQITSDVKNGSGGGKRVFAADGRDFQMTCPKCGRQEAVAPEVFEKVGAVLRVECPCHCTFRIIREMRHTFRKTVRLEGLFAQDVNDLNKMAVVNIWGPMVVTNISKTGVNFTSDKAGLLRSGDRVHLRFYLDNSSKTLIKKNAQVKSVHGDTVGCQFQGTDRYDVTLGFYFL